MNVLEVEVSNEQDAVSYPAFADYTLFGGIYRQVMLIAFDGPHFSMAKHGSMGVFVTPLAGGLVRVDAFTDGGWMLHARTMGPDGGAAAEADVPVTGEKTAFTLRISEPLLWEGRKAPHLYRLTLTLDDADTLTIPFGFRTVAADAERGFLLNGHPYPLHGVSRHQDRENMGWAIGPEQHSEDLDIIEEIGANTVRLPHYQQDDVVLEQCDERGLVVWAETPMNSEYLPGETANRLIEQQLTEMILQQYNHPSVCFWSLANEISIGGVSEELIEELRSMQRLAKSLDPTRLTTMANIGTLESDSPLWFITDTVAVNQYLGWYNGNREDYGPVLDRLHAALPGRPLALSEYGAEAVLKWHSDHPQRMDYTEEYQALVHESAWEAIAARPWLMGSWVWNMFDFAANHRSEGGAKGRNNKGLVTYDRKTRKDAFWFYKACWSDEPFVYITGKRFTRRAGESVDIKVYSNLPEVTLSNGRERFEASGRTVFLFPAVPLTGETTVLTARAQDCEDELVLTRTDKPDPRYVLPQRVPAVDMKVEQWFAGFKKPMGDITHETGYFTMDSHMSDIARSPEAMQAVEQCWARPLEISAPDQAARLRKGGDMSPSQIWHFISRYLPEEAYALLDDALSKIRRETA